MPNGTVPGQTPRDRDRARARRVLVCEASAAGAALAARLAGAGYEVRRASADTVQREIENFSPQLLVVEFGEDDDAASVARRAGDAVERVPLVVVYGVRVEAPRDVARECRADDCFALSTPTPQALARLDSLFWRVGAGRDLASDDAARAARERLVEIEGFMQLLDAARAEFGAGAAGALALVAPVSHGDDREALLREAYEFLQSNLRRADAVAFYGPDMLVAHLPRRRADSAREDLTKLCREFDGEHARARIAVGVARAPEDGTEIEELIERAEVALGAARSPGSHSRVVFHSGRGRETRAERSPEEPSGIVADATDSGAGGTSRAPLSLTIEDSPVRADEESARAAPPPTPAATPRAPESSLKIGREPSAAADAHESPAPADVRDAAPTVGRALRESRRGESYETSVLPQQGGAGGGVLPKSAAEAALRERELRAAGTSMPRSVLLTVSDPARMAQVNLLLRSASYEVRAAFDGGQALDLLRIRRADLLLLDYELKLLNGLEVLRRLGERHGGQPPLPIVLLYPPAAGALVREEARRLGAAGLVQLPYDPAELLAAVRETGAKIDAG